LKALCLHYLRQDGTVFEDINELAEDGSTRCYRLAREALLAVHDKYSKGLDIPNLTNTTRAYSEDARLKSYYPTIKQYADLEVRLWTIFPLLTMNESEWLVYVGVVTVAALWSPYE
jgi:hypothetical protein